MVQRGKLNQYDLFIWLMVGVAALLRVWLAKRFPIWFDEALSIEAARQSWLTVLTGHYATDNSPPFYLLLLKLSFALVGEREGFMRLLSIAASLLSIVLGAQVARMLSANPCAPVWAAALIASAPDQLFLGVELRAYSLLIMLSLLAIVLALRSRTQPKLIGWAWLLACIATYTHYFGILVFVPVLLAGASNWKRALALVSITALACLPLLPIFRFQSELGVHGQFGASGMGVLATVIAPWPAIVAYDPMPNLGLVIVVGLLGVISLWLGWRQITRFNQLWMGLLIASTLAIILVSAALNVRILPRHWVHITVISLVIHAVTLSQRPAYWGALVVGVLLAVSVSIAWSPPIMGPNWLSAAQQAKQRGAAYAVVGGWDGMPAFFYLRQVGIQPLTTQEYEADPKSPCVYIQSIGARQIAHHCDVITIE